MFSTRGEIGVFYTRETGVFYTRETGVFYTRETGVFYTIGDRCFRCFLHKVR